MGSVGWTIIGAAIALVGLWKLGAIRWPGGSIASIPLPQITSHVGAGIETPKQSQPVAPDNTSKHLVDLLRDTIRSQNPAIPPKPGESSGSPAYEATVTVPMKIIVAPQHTVEEGD